jgi:sugar lactone lactonase YvrE
METRHDEDVWVVEPKQPEVAEPGHGTAASELPLDQFPPSEVTDEQALIEEARRRQRRRQRWIAAVVVLALAGTAVGLGVSFANRAPAPRALQGESSSVPLPSGPSAVALDRPEALAIAANGDVLIANQGTNQILRRTPAGQLTVVAGTGSAGYSGDGGPARRAELDDPGGIAVALDGTIYVADTGNNRVRAISPSGTITTVAGNGHLGTRGVGGPAVNTEVGQPVAVALGTQGRLYVVDNAGVQLIAPTGVLTTLIAAGPGRLSVDGASTAFFPSAIAVGRAGNLYVADSSPKLLIELSSTGQVLHSWPTYVTQAGLATAPAGSVLVADYGQFAVDRIVSNQLTSIATFKRNSLAGLTGTFRPSGIAVSRSGRLYVDTDGVNGGTNRPAIAGITTAGQVQVLTTRTGTRR